MFKACKHPLNRAWGLKLFVQKPPGSKEVIERRGTLEAEPQSGSLLDTVLHFC